MKVCAKCAQEKPLGEFRQRTGARAGKPYSYCIPCMKEYQRQRAQTPEGRESSRQRTRSYSISEHGRERNRARRASAHGRALAHKYSVSDKGRAVVRAASRAWQKRHPGQAVEYVRGRLASDTWFYLSFLIRRRLRYCVERNCRPKTFHRNLGCSRDEFRARMERLFRPGMTWENMGAVWEFDHDVPLSAFDLTNPEQFASASDYRNLVPRWPEENAAKGATLPWRMEASPT